MQRNLWHEEASVKFVSRSWCLGSCKRFVAWLGHYGVQLTFKFLDVIVLQLRTK